MALTHCIFDLCARPEYLEPLRAEAKAALVQDNGKWQLSTLSRLRKLDSFLKESQRMNQSTFCMNSPTPASHFLIFNTD